MYPGSEVLQEVGRITIAGSRLDLAMANLWHHLDRYVPYEETRKRAGAEQDRWVRLLAEVRLVGPLRDRVLKAVMATEDARRRRNNVVHQDWVLEARHERPLQELLDLSGEEEAAYLHEWQRQARDSLAWQRIPPRKTQPEPAPSLDELIAIERVLARVTDEITSLTFVVASSREFGIPIGYVHPD
ncbi:hypothetical protein [Geodermatophilus sp. CPCC 205506]|uniref:hypothetical protein n=1 Tax=Geodermatophilus sp. CPCC 205506 TaxID=2936596 RepID=UPI003EEF61D5